MKASIFTPVVTAFNANGEIDKQANINIYEHLIKGGVDGIVLMGSTGEFFSMTDAQKKELIDIAAETINHRVKLYVGTSCMRTDDTIQLSNYALDAGADAVMIISPYYFSLSKASIEAFYDEVADQIHGNIYLYNFPDRTGYDLTPELTLNLVRKHKNIVGFKDTVTEMGHTRALLTTILPEFPEFRIFSGYDENLVHNVLSGGCGCIGGLSNLYPEIFAEWVKAINAHDVEKTTEYQRKIDVMMDLYDIGVPFMPVMKKAMMLHGIELQDTCMKPFLPVTEEQIEKIQALMNKIEA